MKWFIFGALIAVGGSMLGCDGAEVSSIEAERQSLIKPPELDWQPCECNGLTRGLSDGDIMKLNMYLSSDTCEVGK